jgi:hypothetical protein
MNRLTCLIIEVMLTFTRVGVNCRGGAAAKRARRSQSCAVPPPKRGRLSDLLNKLYPDEIIYNQKRYSFNKKL